MVDAHAFFFGAVCYKGTRACVMTPTERAIVFWVGCVGLRLFLAYSARCASTEALRWAGLVALLPACGFFYLFVTNGRREGREAGGRIWWTGLRPVHGALYLAFAVLAIRGCSDVAWVPLAADVLVGALAWLWYYACV